jgi:hypothetical protein
MNRLQYGVDECFNKWWLSEIDEAVFQYTKLREEGASGNDLYEPLKKIADWSGQITGYKHQIIKHFSKQSRDSTIRRIESVGWEYDCEITEEPT